MILSFNVSQICQHALRKMKVLLETFEKLFIKFDTTVPLDATVAFFYRKVLLSLSERYRWAYSFKVQYDGSYERKMKLISCLLYSVLVSYLLYYIIYKR